MTAIPLRAEWPGLPARRDETAHYPTGMVSMAYELRQQVHHLGSADAGGLPTLRVTTDRLSTRAFKEGAYGHGYTAEAVWRMHRDAWDHLMPVYEAIALNLDAAAKRLEIAAERYRRIGRELEADLRRFAEYQERGDHEEVRQWQPSTSAERWTPTTETHAETTVPDLRPADHILPRTSPRMSGSLSIATVSLPRERAEFYHPLELAGSMRRIQKARAWSLHYHIGKAWRDVADALDMLCARIYSVSDELSGYWHGPAAGRAQLAFRNIDGTARGLEVFARSMSASSRETGTAIEQVVAPIRLGRSGSQSRRDTAAQDGFDQLTGRYREILLQPMRELAYDLPFGGLILPVDERTPLRVDVPTMPLDPQPVTVDSVVPPVIGVSSPFTGDLVWSPDPLWLDPQDWAPSVIG